MLSVKSIRACEQNLKETVDNFAESKAGRMASKLASR